MKVKYLDFYENKIWEIFNENNVFGIFHERKMFGFLGK
jgi:hypothetical protein